MKKPFKLKPTWKPQRLEYVNFRPTPYSNKWVAAQIIAMTAHSITFVMFNTRTVETWARFGIEDHIKESKHQRKVKRIVFINQLES